MTERFMDAVLSLRYQQLEALLKTNVSVNTRNRLGQTPVMVACYISNEEKSYRMFKFLLKKGADIMESDNNRTSVFQHACKQGRERIARRIIREMSVAAANLGGKNQDGRTPLFDAVSSGNVSLVKFIVKLMRERSLGVDTPDHSGVTPLIQAYKIGFIAIAAVLEKDGNANPRICDGVRHMNASEWAEEAASKRLAAQALLRERTREHKMIYPHLNHRKLPPFSSHVNKNSSIPEIKPRWDWGTINTKSDIIGGSNWNSDSQRIAERNCNSSIVEKSLQMSTRNAPSMSSVVNKSLDSAMTLLVLSSNTSENRHYAMSFVSSEFDRSKTSKYSNLAEVNSLFQMYSSQFSNTFRQPAKPLPPKPIPGQPILCEKKASTLAYIMGRGSLGDKDRRHSKKRTGRRNYRLGIQQISRRSNISSSDSIEKLVKTKEINDGDSKRHARVQQDVLPRCITKGETQDPAEGNKDGEEGDRRGKPRRNSKTFKSRKLSRVPEDDQGCHQTVPQTLNHRDSLPNIRVTVPSA